MTKRRVEISIGKTINLGNYESIRVQVGLSEDIPEKGELEKSFDYIYDKVNGKLCDYCDELEKEHTNERKRKR